MEFEICKGSALKYLLYLGKILVYGIVEVKGSKIKSKIQIISLPCFVLLAENKQLQHIVYSQHSCPGHAPQNIGPDSPHKCFQTSLPIHMPRTLKSTGESYLLSRRHHHSSPDCVHGVPHHSCCHCHSVAQEKGNENIV